MTQEEKTKIEAEIVEVLKTVYDPEIPVNIYDLGMIYKIDLQDDGTLEMDMTFTSPACPAADYIRGRKNQGCGRERREDSQHRACFRPYLGPEYDVGRSTRRTRFRLISPIASTDFTHISNQTVRQ